jgi:hypothetical protein
VQPTLAERGDRVPGDAFPVFELAGVGTVGLCICYDMLFPETTRVLALNGAELVFHCTLGGTTQDFRARLWREHNPAAYAVLVDPQPPALRRLAGVPVEDVATSGDRFAAALTTGAEAFDEGERWLQAGNAARARARFVELLAQFGTVWIGRAARERLARIDTQEAMG